MSCHPFCHYMTTKVWKSLALWMTFTAGSSEATISHMANSSPRPSISWDHSNSLKSWSHSMIMLQNTLWLIFLGFAPFLSIFQSITKSLLALMGTKVESCKAQT